MPQRLLIIICALLVFASCSKEEIHPQSDLIGVWERTTITENFTDVYRLVFKNQTEGRELFIRTDNDGRVISTISFTTWEMNGSNELVIYKEGEIIEIFELVEIDGNFQLVNGVDAPLDKITNDVSDY